jgi:hypothetical protein
VRYLLVEYGIPADMIDAIGLGSLNLRDPGTSERAHQRNRRVEFVVMARRPLEPAEEDERKKAAEDAKKKKTKGAKRDRKKRPSGEKSGSGEKAKDGGDDEEARE